MKFIDSFLSGESCKCNLLTPDDYRSMIVSTLGEFIGNVA